MGAGCCKVAVKPPFAIRLNFHNCLILLMELRGIEPQDSGTSPHTSSIHNRAQDAHFRALQPSHASPDSSLNAPSIHEQHTDVHDERARSVHMDPDLAAVNAAWPTLSATVRTAILRLIATKEVAP
jgi:hypothetical protein